MFSLILEPYNTLYPSSSVIYKAKADGVTFNTAYSAVLARKGITYSGKVYNILHIMLLCDIYFLN